METSLVEDRNQTSFATYNCKRLFSSNNKEDFTFQTNKENQFVYREPKRRKLNDVHKIKYCNNAEDEKCSNNKWKKRGHKIENTQGFNVVNKSNTSSALMNLRQCEEENKKADYNDYKILENSLIYEDSFSQYNSNEEKSNASMSPEVSNTIDNINDDQKEKNKTNVSDNENVDKNNNSTIVNKNSNAQSDENFVTNALFVLSELFSNSDSILGSCGYQPNNNENNNDAEKKKRIKRAYMLKIKKTQTKKRTKMKK